MQPAIFFPGKDNAIAGSPEQLTLGNHCVECAARGFIRAPDLMARSIGGVCNANAPRLRGFASAASTGAGGNADEGDLAAIARPCGIAVAIDARVHVRYILSAEIVDRDERVIAAIADE